MQIAVSMNNVVGKTASLYISVSCDVRGVVLQPPTRNGCDVVEPFFCPTDERQLNSNCSDSTLAFFIQAKWLT